MKKYINIFCSLAVILLMAGCDQISMNELMSHEPAVASFLPQNGSLGCEITVDGSYLDDVDSAYIGGEPVTIARKISDKQLVLAVTKNVKGGKLKLQNSTGSTESEGTFTRDYVAPSINSSSIPASADLGSSFLIEGTNMNVVEDVYFTANGYAQGNKAVIINQNTKEVYVRVPYVENANVKITLGYDNGSTEVFTPIASAPGITIIRKTPSISSLSTTKIFIGRSVTMTGENLDKINHIYAGKTACTISDAQSDKLTFSVPSSDFADGDNYTTLTATYFDDRETVTINSQIDVCVPFLKFWENMKSYGQGRDVESMASFFSPETGLVYANSDWRTVVDPVSYKYGVKTCSASNKPAVTEEEYNSVNPYFFFSGVSSGALQINSPAGSATQLKNFYFVNNSANDYRVTGASANWYGTPALAYAYLDPAVYSDLVSDVRNQTLSKIDEQSFPVDEAAGTVGGVPYSSFKTTVNNTVFAPNKFQAGVAADNVNVDAVLMVIYFNYNGAGINNIKRIGFIHIKSVNFRMWNNTASPASSDVTFNVYWQKYDYKNK
jgi:hypothetical protein